MEIKMTVTQFVFGLLQFLGYVATALSIAYYFGKKFSTIELTVKNAMEKVEELADRVEKISDRMWEERGKGKL